MANQFSVQPLGGLQNMQMIGQGMQGIAENFQQDAAQEQKQALMQQAGEIMGRGNPREIAQFSMQNPEIGEAMMGSIQFKDDVTRENLKTSMQGIIAGRDPEQVLQSRIQTVESRGGDASDTRRELEALQEMGPEQYRGLVQNEYAMMFGDEGLPGTGDQGEPAGVREIKAKLDAAELEPGTERYKEALLIELGLEPRAGISATERMANNPELAARVAELEAQLTGAKETEKLKTQLELQPQVAAAVDKAKADVAAEAKIAKEDRGNAKTLQMYDTAMSNLTDALGGTTTGPGMGWIPAMTSNAQIAEGAQAIMAPILKSMFRTAGEGTFTDKDQEMLMNMIPTRSDLPKARQAKLQAIDAVVRAKLGVDPDDDSDGDKDSKPVSEMTDEELMNQAFGGGQ